MGSSGIPGTTVPSSARPWGFPPCRGLGAVHQGDMSESDRRDSFHPGCPKGFPVTATASLTMPAWDLAPLLPSQCCVFPLTVSGEGTGKGYQCIASRPGKARYGHGKIPEQEKRHPCVFRKKMLEGSSWCKTARALTALSLGLGSDSVQVRS